MQTTRYRFLSASLLGLMTLFLAGCGGPNLLDRLNSPWGYGCCGFILLILDVVALVEVVGSTRTTGNKVLWALLIICFPVGGLILYYLFGRID